MTTATPTKPTVLIISTLDTKLEETLYLRDQIAAHGTCATKVLDVGRTALAPALTSSIQDELIPNPADPATMTSMARPEYISSTVKACTPVILSLVTDGQISGMIAAGGSCNSTLAASLMRACAPIGFPKVLVSTVASGNVKPYVEETDVTIMYSVVDVAGMNSILGRILSNAAGAIVGMSSAYARSRAQALPAVVAKKRIAITMFGVTTPAVTLLRRMLLAAPSHDPEEIEIYVFHATGAGGLAMERLIADNLIDAVVDLTTTEVADHLVGGVMTAGPDRLSAAAKRGIPTIVSVGACDMVNFGLQDSVPPVFQGADAGRKFVQHNASVTLMRTTPEENTKIGEFIAAKLSTSQNPSVVKVLLPLGGVSMLDAPGQPFHDPVADEALFEALETGLVGSEVEVERVPGNINDEGFVVELLRASLDVMGVGADSRKHRLANQRRRKWSFDHGASMRKLSIGSP